MVTSSIKSKNSSTLYSPHGPSQSGEWTFSVPFPQEKAKWNSLAIDYFTKWIEVKPLATIIAQQVQ